jgi:hypothetical protein
LNFKLRDCFAVRTAFDIPKDKNPRRLASDFMKSVYFDFGSINLNYNKIILWNGNVFSPDGSGIPRFFAWIQRTAGIAPN